MDRASRASRRRATRATTARTTASRGVAVERARARASGRASGRRRGARARRARAMGERYDAASAREMYADGCASSDGARVRRRRARSRRRAGVAVVRRAGVGVGGAVRVDGARADSVRAVDLVRGLRDATAERRRARYRCGDSSAARQVSARDVVRVGRALHGVPIDMSLPGERLRRRRWWIESCCRLE